MAATIGVNRAPQYMAALERANEVRIYRAGLKRAVRNRLFNAADVLGDIVEPDLETMPIGELLMAVPGIGRTKARSMTAKVGASLTRPLGELTVRQRRELRAIIVNRARLTVVPTEEPR